MTTTLHLPAVAGAPVACDLSTADDTPDERLAAYRALFAQELTRSERALVLTFAPAARERVEELARREGACCPFLDQRVETDGEEVRWTIAGPEAVLEAFAALPGYGPSASSTDRMFPAGSRNQAIGGPSGPRTIPFASCSKPS